MRLATRRHEDGHTTAVAIDGDEVIDLGELGADAAAVFAAGPDALQQAQERIARGGRMRLGDITLDSPVLHPQKFLAVGLNYADHVAESGVETPEFPTVFAKMPSCVAGPYDDVLRPSVSDKLDYEGELGFVIGTRCKHVSRDRAHEVIAGYTIINDVSVRDFQLRTSQWVVGKSFDTHGPIGPWIVTPDEVDPHTLAIRTIVNGEVRQSSNTSNLIFDCFAQVELLSSAMTLEPGDVVATGTPGGVGIASDTFLAPGDVVRVEIEGIGAIENRVVDEPR
jgi:2-keto-4-pentenoate hydratase/2-oxohepta-3-ene-1,7-dioic acid hydratase in catechol pathway